MVDQPCVLRDCPDRPNCVCTQATRGWQRMQPLQIHCQSSDAMEKIVDLLSTMPRVRIVEQRIGYLQATFTSRLLRFIDDVEFLIDDSSQTLHFRSASRIGYSDLGANRARMHSIVKRLLESESFSRFDTGPT